MKLITRETDYAARALCFIAQKKGAGVSAAELAATLKMPRPFLRKILQILNRAGLLSSSKGKRGGFKLARSPEKIYLLELIRIFQGPLSINECLLKKAPCPNTRKCKLKQRLDKIQRYITTELQEVTLALLMKGK